VRCPAPNRDRECRFSSLACSREGASAAFADPLLPVSTVVRARDGLTLTVQWQDRHRQRCSAAGTAGGREGAVEVVPTDGRCRGGWPTARSVDRSPPRRGVPHRVRAYLIPLAGPMTRPSEPELSTPSAPATTWRTAGCMPGVWQWQQRVRRALAQARQARTTKGVGARRASPRLHQVGPGVAVAGELARLAVDGLRRAVGGGDRRTGLRRGRQWRSCHPAGRRRTTVERAVGPCWRSCARPRRSARRRTGTGSLERDPAPTSARTRARARRGSAGCAKT